MLDRSRSYGELRPPGEGGAFYVQDHKTFDAAGREIKPAISQETPAPRRRGRPPKNATRQGA